MDDKGNSMRRRLVVSSEFKYGCMSLPLNASTSRFRVAPRKKNYPPLFKDINPRALMSAVSKCGIFLLSGIIFQSSWPLLEVFSIFHSCIQLLPFKSSTVSQPLQSVTIPITGLTLARPLFQIMFPDVYRTVRFWRRLIPIYARYIITKLYARGRSPEDKDKIWAKTHEWGGKKVHQLVLDMSGFYVKSAQILASKADFVPDAWRKYLSKHLDDAPPRPFTQVKRSIQEQLGKYVTNLPVEKNDLASLGAVFMSIDSRPIAAASIAQVHGAVLKDGTQVVIKVQHLGMEMTMHSDLRNLGRVACFLKGQLPVDLTQIVKEIQATIPLEFDFEREVWFMNSISRSLHMHGFTDIVCPLPFVDLCTKRLIVMKRLDGTPFTRILHPDASDKRIPELRILVKYLLKAYGHMFFVDGVFHADPHAGNLLLLPNLQLGLLDFGQSKVMDCTTKKMFARMVVALSRKNDMETAVALTEMGICFENANGGDVSLSTLAMMAQMLFDTCYVEEATISPLSDKSILKTVPMTAFNQDMWLVVRTILLLRGLIHSLSMDVSAAAIWEPYASKNSVWGSKTKRQPSNTAN